MLASSPSLRILPLAVLALLARGRPRAAAQEEAAAKETLVVGSISARPAEEIRKFSPFARYLARQLRPLGLRRGRVVVAPDIRGMARFMKAGKVDLYIDSPFPVAAVQHLAGARLLLRRWKKKVREYRGAIFTREGSTIRGLRDLRGKMIALEDPFSSSGYFFPKLALIRAGLKVARKPSFEAAVGPDEAGYVFSGSKSNTLLWVLRGRVAAGAMSEPKLKKAAGRRLEELRVIHRTPRMPRHVVACRRDLPDALVQRICAVLTGLDRSERGRAVLAAFEKTVKFDALSTENRALLALARGHVAREIEQQQAAGREHR